MVDSEALPTQTRGVVEHASTDDEVRDALAAWLDALNGRDLERFETLFDPDVLYANAAAPLRRGRTTVVDAWRPLFEGPEPLLEFTEEAVFTDRSMGLITGTWRFVASGDDGEPKPTASGRVALVFRRATDGTWRLLFDMDNSPPDTAL